MSTKKLTLDEVSDLLTILVKLNVAQQEQLDKRNLWFLMAVLILTVSQIALYVSLV